MATSDVTFQDGLKHPYLLALVRWCMSSFWRTATVILHRLITAPIPQVKAPKQTKYRPASYSHLHPEPRVDCEVLHTPEDHTLDVIFVHGLYGSLGNTWRQGEWHTKYDKQPNKTSLRRPHSIPTCQCTDGLTNCCSDNKNNVSCEERDEISQPNDNNTNGRTCNDNKHDKLDNKNEINDKSYEINDKYTKSDTNNRIEQCWVDETGEINEDYDKIKIVTITRQKDLKDDNAIRKTDCNIARNDKSSDNNLRNYGFIDRKNELYDKIKDLEVRLPSSNLQEYTSDITKCIDEEINDSKANTSLYDTIKDINVQKDYTDEDLINREISSNLYDNLQKILPKENLLITEKFYNNTLLDDDDIGSYKTQAQFVKDWFENSVKVKSESESEREVKASDCKCEVKCEPGCGCICDDCYSPCWPKDWIRMDYPGARVISINYTSDPYLWRPLWVKESKRLCLHERAEQMMSQLLDLGVGERPIIWVGHSKGGLFIKKMYCEAYEANLKLTKQNQTKGDTSEPANEQNTTESRNDNEINHCRDQQTDNINGNTDENLNESNEFNDPINEINEPMNDDIDEWRDKINENVHRDVNLNEINGKVNDIAIKDIEKQYFDKKVDEMMINTDVNSKETNEINDRVNELNKSVNNQTYQASGIEYTDVKLHELNDQRNEAVDINDVNLNEIDNPFNDNITRDVDNKKGIVNSESFDYILMNNRTGIANEFALDDNNGHDNEKCDKNRNIPNFVTDVDDEEEKEPLLNINETQLLKRASLWRKSAGFMFYSVPHRGSPLADIKTPITARSIELMEICKDCPLVLSLQQSWSAATAPTRPAVRSLVETCRTLMSVLYLRIVSVDSADPGIGSLNGVDVDHREICKPSSRECLLYQELMTLMETALNTQ
ncbi:putative leucine-rich repeat-containing protein DDB_G0290503 [Maniola hyperantus]|uniref:putative leucine-rich repeat-containing protein DDB_G0290503 n=1 Tax=Aphantopus hyperantus TaxID=2795564 RepID=UPI00156917BF|nr:uncharacterized protein PFB0145c [Maniola hyperantus]